MVNLPNIITGLRILLTPMVVSCFILQCYKTSFWLLIIAGLTDWLDGFCARYFHQETSFGRSFDPIADKILLVSVYWTLSIYYNFIPWWLGIAVISRDVLIVVGVIILKVKSIIVPISPIFISKFNTVMQICLSLLIIGQAAYVGEKIKLEKLNSSIFIITFITTLCSGISYFKIFYHSIYKKDRI